MSLLWLAVGLVAALRLAELALARRNTRRLLARGWMEAGGGHYPLLVALHGAWLGALLLLVPADAPPSWPLIGLYGLLQAARAWVIWSLGPLWTTRVVTRADAPLVRRGPYRWLDHPNYAIVAAEIPLLPLAFGAWELALGFGAANLALLAVRVRAENRALAPRRSLEPGGGASV